MKNGHEEDVMFGFLIKKTFFDMWDNLITIVLMNLGFIASLAVVVYVPYALSFNTVLAYIGLAVALFIFNLYSGTISMMVGDIADYKRCEFKDFLPYLRSTIKYSGVLTLITCVQLVIVAIGFPFYLQMGGVFGVLALAVLFWISLAAWLSLQYFFPVRKRLDASMKKIFKKSLILFFDNTAFSFGLALGGIVILAISVFTALLIPGIATFLLWRQVAVKLRLLKYDYLEENPDANRKKIPWDALLVDDREKVGPRSLKGMIFPWKE
jgi:hypothetical protein